MTNSGEAMRFWAVSGPIIATGAAAACAISIILLRPLLQRYALAQPNARSSHRDPTPQGAGIAVIAATIIVTILASLAIEDAWAVREAWLPFILAATALIAAVGALADLRPVPIAARLALQAIAIGAMVAALPVELRIAPVLPWWVERTILLLGLLWFVNLVNFMDGIDWMTVAEVVPLTVGLVLIGIHSALPPAAIVVAFALGGAMIGFAPFNRPVAQLFLGDVGSLPIGLLLGWLLLLVAGRGHVAAALLLPLYYLADSTITLVRRLLNGEAIWQAHRSHFYQRATDRGYSVSEVVVRVLAVNLCLAALAIGTVIANNIVIDIAVLSCGAAIVACLLVAFSRGRR